MNHKNYLESIRQGFEDPTEYQPKTRCCDICDIEEEKTYFVDNTSICQDCFEEEEQKEYIKKYILPNETEENKNLYYNGCLQYDREYIEEHQKQNTLFNN